MNTHREDAAFFLERARTNPDTAEALADSTAAVAHATLALVEEQRTANLQAYMADTMAERRNTKGVGAAGLKVIDDWISEKMKEIRERLGMEK
ncbi:hypothetical protein SEA_ONEIAGILLIAN_50 [Microbacterium phage OneinaGillian]|uniref:Uncharacterized protein n=1 Tax=Microbacterium phage OneinaGillian TaxID=2301604 RepID=A0A385UGW4_9CAUD|nr:hypothetical protein HOU23_gp050 [Microbacterium phage OneinaGillian]AYB70160.1 hypothetical protein SEA_ONEIAGILLIAN_50 [Microbacterium phage OneinaGillian]